MSSAAHELDAADMRALQRGEALALNRLMARWQVPLRSFLFRSTQSEHDALDLAQETFVRVYLHRARFRTDAKFSTWMFQIALNLARDHARHGQRRPTTPLASVPEPEERITAVTALSEREQADAVRTAIAELPADLREAILLSEYEHRSHAEIASIVGATAKAVETRLYRARALLRKTLQRFLREVQP